MHPVFSRLTALACAALAFQAQAQAKDTPPPIKPGLWQIDSKMA